MKKKSGLRLRDIILCIALGLVIAGVGGYSYFRHFQSEQAIAVNQQTRQKIRRIPRLRLRRKRF